MDDPRPTQQLREEQILAFIKKPRPNQPKKSKGKLKPIRDGKITLKIQAAMPELTLEEARRRGLWLLLQSLENGWDRPI